MKLQEFRKLIREEIRRVVNEASRSQIDKTTFQAFIKELGTWPEFQSKVENPGDIALTKAKDSPEFLNLLRNWHAGMYDNDMDTLVSDLNAAIKSAKSKLDKSKQEEAKTNYVSFWYMDRYNEGNSSVTFKGDKSTLEKIQKKYLPELEELLRKNFQINDYAKKSHGNKNLVGDSFLKKWNKDSKHYSLSFYPQGWMLDGYNEDKKFVQYIKNWVIKLAKNTLRFDVKQ